MPGGAAQCELRTISFGLAKILCRERTHESRHFDKMQMKKIARKISTWRCRSKVQREAWFSREFETCKRQRTRIDIFCEPERLKTAAKHFRMQQCLQFSLHL